jgi:hypothetical protein
MELQGEIRQICKICKILSDLLARQINELDRQANGLTDQQTSYRDAWKHQETRLYT